jgi:acyl carrier protein
VERSAIEKAITVIIVRHLMVDPEEVTPGSSLRDDLGADSLDVVELTMEFEEKFNIVIPDEEAEKLTTVKQVYDYIEAKINQSKM